MKSILENGLQRHSKSFFSCKNFIKRKLNSGLLRYLNMFCTCFKNERVRYCSKKFIQDYEFILYIGKTYTYIKYRYFTYKLYLVIIYVCERASKYN